MERTRAFLRDELGLPGGDAYHLPTSDKRFADGGQYRVEIPSVEGPAALRAVLDEAAARDVAVHRVSQGSGVMLQTDAEIRDMGARVAARRGATGLRHRGRTPRGGAWRAQRPGRRHRPVDGAGSDEGPVVAAGRPGAEGVGVAGGRQPRNRAGPGGSRCRLAEPAGRPVAAGHRRDPAGRRRTAGRLRRRAGRLRRPGTPLRDTRTGPDRCADLRQVHRAKRTGHVPVRAASGGDGGGAVPGAGTPGPDRAGHPTPVLFGRHSITPAVAQTDAVSAKAASWTTGGAWQRRDYRDLSGAELSRTTSSVASSMPGVSISSPCASRSTVRAARTPISASGWRTVVSGGEVQRLSGRSSKPTTLMSSGTRRPRRRTASGDRVDDGQAIKLDPRGVMVLREDPPQ